MDTTAAGLARRFSQFRAAMMPFDDQSAEIDRLIHAELTKRLPAPEWVFTLQPGRILHATHWLHGRELRSERQMVDISCAELEAAGEGWLDLALSKIPQGGEVS